MSWVLDCNAEPAMPETPTEIPWSCWRPWSGWATIEDDTSHSMAHTLRRYWLDGQNTTHEAIKWLYESNRANHAGKRWLKEKSSNLTSCDASLFDNPFAMQ